MPVGVYAVIRLFAALLILLCPPAAAEEALPAWQANAVEVDLPDYVAPMIAIVIDDMGVNRKMTRKAIELPAPITASFLPYAGNLESQTARAKAAGHELMLHMPMQPFSPYKDAGAGALTVSMNESEILAALDSALSAFDGKVGINNHMGSRFTANPDLMRIVLDELNRRGLLFLDSVTSKYSVGYETAREIGMPAAKRQVFLDNTAQEIPARLKELERYASKHGAAIGIGHPRKATVEALQNWMPDAAERGFVFVPVSTIAAQQADEE